jgi:hypothetical protein
MKLQRWRETSVVGAKNRLLQLVARVVPGATSLRVHLHRWRGLKIGKGVWIGYDAIIETSKPQLVTIGDDAAIGIRATVIAHFREVRGVSIGLRPGFPLSRLTTSSDLNWAPIGLPRAAGYRQPRP